MAIAAPARQFYLGIGGQQSGPHTEKDVLDRISRGEIPGDALVWFEGLSDWQPIQSLEFFKQAFEPAQPTMQDAPRPTLSQPLSQLEGQPQLERPVMDRPRRLSSNGELEPVFSEEEAVFATKGKEPMLVAVGCLALAFVAAGAYLFWNSNQEDIDQREAQLKSAAPKPGVKEATPVREARLKKAKEELLLSPDANLRILAEMAIQDPGDPAGKEATTIVLQTYTRDFKYGDVGRFLLSLKRTKEAAEAFLKDPASTTEAEKALFAAYESSQTPSEKKELLLKNIQILLTPLDNVKLATERIRLLEKEFKENNHPYRFYMKTPLEQLAELFPRVSFFYVQTLLQFMELEFPELKLVNRPLVEIKKDREDAYRIVGTYRGDVTLNKDRLKEIKLRFWQVNEQWHLVETNLTPERKRFAETVRKQFESKTFTAQQLLEQVQRVFRAQFPKTPYHEPPVARAPVSQE